MTKRKVKNANATAQAIVALDSQFTSSDNSMTMQEAQLFDAIVAKHDEAAIDVAHSVVSVVDAASDATASDDATVREVHAELLERDTVVAAHTTVRRIERDRLKSAFNNMQRPSKGGLCREVWDTIDDMRAQNAQLLNCDASELRTLCTVKQIKERLSARNQNNVSAEFYAYRKFYNIRGRV